MTITTKTGDKLTFDETNKLEVLTRYINRMGIISATIEEIPAEKLNEFTPGRYLLMEVKTPEGVDVDGAETFIVTIDLEPEKEAD